MIANALAARSDMHPAVAVAHARHLQGLVAANELHNMLSNLGLRDASRALLQ
jgi:hypothetical protein